MRSLKQALILSLALHLFFLGLVSFQFPSKKEPRLVKVKLSSLSQASLKPSGPPKSKGLKKKKLAPKKRSHRKKSSKKKKVVRKSRKKRSPKKRRTKGAKRKVSKSKKRRVSKSSKPQSSPKARSAKNRAKPRSSPKSPPLRAQDTEEKLRQKLASLEEEVLLKQRLEAIKNRSVQGGASPGGSTRGKGVSEEDLAALLQAHLASFWEVPLILKDRSHLSAIAEIKLAPDGKLLFSKLLKSSGNRLFDQAVKVAIKSADPYPPPGHPLTVKAVFTPQGLKL